MPVEFTFIAGKRRAVYQQLDGTFELADACKCGARFELDCPIDEHKIKARVRELLQESA